MARTILRNESADLVALVQLADRTGIVAASAPPPYPAAPNPASPGPDDLPRTAGSGRVRRQALFLCAALALVTLGWIGGRTFTESNVGHVPDLAVGMTEVLENDNQSAVPDPPAPEVTPAVPTTTESQSPSPAPKHSKGKETPRSTANSEPVTAKTPTPAGSSHRPPGDDAMDRATSMMNALAGRFARLESLLDSWKANGRGPARYYRNSTPEG